MILCGLQHDLMLVADNSMLDACGRGTVWDAQLHVSNFVDIEVELQETYRAFIALKFQPSVKWLQHLPFFRSGSGQHSVYQKPELKI